MGIRDKVSDLLKMEEIRKKINPENPEGPLNLPPGAEKIPPEKWLRMQKEGFNPMKSYPKEIEEELRKRYRDYPEIGAHGLRTKEGIINGKLIWCDGKIAIFDTPQGKIEVLFGNLIAPEGITYEKREKKRKEEIYKRRMEPQQQERRRF